MPGLPRRSSPQNAGSFTPSSPSDGLASVSSSGSVRGRTKVRGGRQVRSPVAVSSRLGIKPGYHVFIAHGKEFCVEKRWKFHRELGSGAYGVVVSVQDEITDEFVAIKMITRLFDKPQLAKRALREITLLRHFNDHDNITGLIDMDVSGPDFNEIYLFMEPMEADLYQIIRSGQSLSGHHIRYFVYQLLRGVKYMHSSDVVHRDLKPGNLLVNSDCELKICDMGLSRGFNTKPRDGEGNDLTEYVATRWYRAPEIMLSFARYGFPIDMWSIGCILGELIGGKPVFKGKDYVDQLNQILLVLGTPSEDTIAHIGSHKARAYIRALPITKPRSWSEVFPQADPDCVDLLGKLLTFNPADRLTVEGALGHPFLAQYHELSDEPENLEKFEKWRDIEKIDTTDGFREALLHEVQEYRTEVRAYAVEASAVDDVVPTSEDVSLNRDGTYNDGSSSPEGMLTDTPVPFPTTDDAVEDAYDDVPGDIPPPSAISRFAADPFRTYSRRSTLSHSIHQRDDSLFGPRTPASVGALGPVTYDDGAGRSYILPARSRVQSSDALGVLGTMAMAKSSGAVEPPPQFLRQLSTRSITALADASSVRGGHAAVVGSSYGSGIRPTAADAPASEMPDEWARKESPHSDSSGAVHGHP